TRHVQNRRRQQQQIEERDRNRDRRDNADEDCVAVVERANGQETPHASTARPLSANNPRGRFWMKRMMITRMAILPRTAPANGPRNLLAMPRKMAPRKVPQRLPTPPKTTTMKESTI